MATEESYFEAQYKNLRLPIDRPDQPGLREAQIAAAHALSGHFFSKREPAIVVMPTGSGKTCVMLLAAFMLRVRRVLIITPSRMVRDQLVENVGSLRLLKKLGAVEHDIALPRVAKVQGQIQNANDWNKLKQKDVVVSTVQSASPFIRGIVRPPSDIFDLVIVDEAHHSPAPSWQVLLECFPDARRALFTATPFRRDDKLVRGRIVFEYSLARARDDGVFGQLKYEPVVVRHGADADLTLARATEARWKADRKAGYRHLVMVRTAQRTRADELAKLYASKTKLRLATILGSHIQNRVRAVVDQLKDGSLDGVICVDMLGEGFDLPTLKIAALHTPHRSLAVTLQFIGRFARTTDSGTGVATFLAIPSEIQTEAEHLYRVGAEWNEIVEGASRRRIEVEQEARNILESFAPVKVSGENPDAVDPGLDLADLAPRFHVKIFHVPDGVDLTRELKLPTPGKPILARRSDEHGVFVCVTRHVARCRWSRNERISDVSYDLFILHFDEATRHLFVASTRREIAVYDAIIGAVALGDARRLAPVELNRVLRGWKEAQFFSIGMRKRSGREESYRMVSGRAADKAIQKADGRFYDRGHCYGKGKEGNIQTMVGFSSSSKVWANQGGTIPEFIKWCRKLASKLADVSAVETGSGLDHLPLPSQVKAFPEHIIAADWSEEFYESGAFALRIPDLNGFEDVSVHHFDFQVGEQRPDEVAFSIVGQGLRIPVTYRLGGTRFFEVDAGSASIQCVEEGEPVGSLEDALNEWYPAFFTANLARLQGDQLSGTPSKDKFDTALIETVDWTAEGVDALVEKPMSGSKGVSLFEWLQARLAVANATVIYNDDGAGEAADFVVLTDNPGVGTDVDLYHCKAAEQEPVPGKRVKDLYEVIGQAVKCAKFTIPGVLLQHLRERAAKANANKRLVRGSRADMDRLLGSGVALSFRIVVVQPGIGLALSVDQDAILAAAHSYLAGANVVGLRVIGSAAP